MIKHTKKNICLIDPLSPYGHKDVNRVLIEQLKDCSFLTVICSHKLIEEKFSEVNYVLLDDFYFYIGPNSFDNRKRLLSVLLKICNKINSNSYDVILFTSYEIITIFVAFNIFHALNKKNFPQIYILNHSNIDDIRNSKIKTFMYKKLNNNIVNLCYEDFIGEFIEKEYKKKWRKIRHNINNYKLSFSMNEVSDDIKLFFTDNEYIYFFFPGEMAFQTEIIEKLIMLDKNGYLKAKKIKFLIKNKKYNYHSENIYICNKYFSNSEYSFLFNKCNFIGIIYNPNNYAYRVSGIFYDAVTFKKPIIYCNNLFFINIINQFGNIGIEYLDDIQKVLDQVSIENFLAMQSNMEKAYNYYSDKNLNHDLHIILDL